MKKIALLLLVSTSLFAVEYPAGLVGQWTFDNPDDLTGATVGNDLVLSGSHQVVSGPGIGDGASQIGVGSFYQCSHDISGNPDWVNNFTIVMDVKIPSIGQYYALYQTNYYNSNDGDWWINPNAEVGVNYTGYSDPVIQPEQWYRLAISVELGNHYDYYLDGQLLHSGGQQSYDGRFAIYSESNGNQVLFFADNNGEDSLIDVAQILLFDRDLSAEELSGIGGFGNQVADQMPPYLQTPTPTSIYVSWHDESGDNPVVEYGLTSDLGMSESGSYEDIAGAKRWHTVQLTNLQPNTSYYYKCTTDISESEVYSFQTQPEDTSTGHIRFIVYGDNRTNEMMHTRIVSQAREKVIDLYGEDISAEINAVINVGDIVTYGWNVAEYEEEYFKPIAGLSCEIPVMVAIGNHEAEADYYYQYMKYDDFAGDEGELYWSMRIAGAKFIGLNSNTQGSTQLTWLESQLNAAEADDSISMVFTFLHHPGRSEVWPDGNTSWVQNNVIPLLASYNKAECLSYGHSHNYERGAWPEGNLQLLLAGGGGSDLDRWGMYSNQEDYLEIFRAHDHFGYTIFDVDLDAKSYIAESYTLGHTDLPLDNILLDSFGRNSLAPIIETPIFVGPPSLAVLPVTLAASEQSNLCSSHFQLITEGGDWQNPLLDSLQDYENVYGDSGSPYYTPIDLNDGIDLTELAVDNALLAEGQAYRWRAKYRDENLHWTPWSAEFQFTVVDPTSVDLPEKTGLLNCFPNPFNPSTTVQYTLLYSGQVNVSIYNLDGQKITTLVNQQEEAGPHSALWDGTDSRGKQLTSGIYLLKMETAETVEVQKVALVR